MPTTTLLYDETCGFCTEVVYWIARRKRGSLIAIMPCQFAVLTDRFPVTEIDCLTSIQLYSGSDTPLVKGQAVARVTSELLDSEWPSRVARLPLIRQALDLGYTFVATNRHRLPGIKEMCAANENSSCGK